MVDVGLFRITLERIVETSKVVEDTLGRLRSGHPESDWSYAGDFMVYSDELFLHFADGAERRMWWVRADALGTELAMSWSLDGIDDLV